MSGPLYRFFTEDHDRLDGLLRRSVTEAGAIDRGAYAEFRAGLLKHISMEEKVLLPAAQRLRGGEPLAMAATLRLDHSVLAAFGGDLDGVPAVVTQALWASHGQKRTAKREACAKP
jgi:hypothetical protein